MHLDLDSSALATTPRYEISDPERISGYMSDAFRPNRSIVRRNTAGVEFRHNSLEFGSTSINLVRYGVAAKVDAPPTDEIYLAMFTLAGYARVDQGDKVFTARPGSFCVLNPSRHLKVDLSHDFEQLTLKINGASVRRCFLALTHDEIDRPVEFTPRAYPIAGQAASFAQLVKAICNDMKNPATGFHHPRVQGHLEEALLNLFLVGFSHNYSALLETTRHTPVPYFLKRAEEYIAANLGQPIALTELAEQAGVSVRSLQSAFRQFRGITPTTYIRNRRLDLVRRQLLAAGTQSSSITDIALAQGFTHLSKFAEYYKARFGETPSKTRAGNK